MAEQHPSFPRLEAAVLALNPEVKGTAKLAQFFGVTPQMVTNWRTRGVSKDGALELQRSLGISATWLLDGLHPVLVGKSQPARLDPTKMAEALVAVQKVQEAMRLQSKPGILAEAIIRVYDMRTSHPEMAEADLAAFDKMIIEAVMESMDGQGKAVKGAGGSVPAPATKRRSVATGR